MRIGLALSALALAAGLSTPALADYRHHHYHGGYRGGDNWVAPLVGGLIVGGMLGAVANQPRYYSDAPVYVEQYPRQTCRNVFVGYDYYGRPQVRLVCGYFDQ